jgi:CARDB
MRTRILTALTLAIALAAPAAADAAPTAAVHLTKCRTGAEPEQRHATYRAQMHSISGSVRMGLRFELVERRPGHPAQLIRDKKLNAWHRSHEGVVKYNYKQKIRQLSPGGSYRTRVKFRWYDADGKVIKRATRTSKACKQTGGLPNLVVSSVSFSEGPSGTMDYTVSIGNTGESPAEDFKVTLFVDGAVVDERTVDRLGAGDSESIQLNGPACRTVRAVVDRDHQVVESVEDDNSLKTTCP